MRPTFPILSQPCHTNSFHLEWIRDISTFLSLCLPLCLSPSLPLSCLKPPATPPQHLCTYALVKYPLGKTLTNKELTGWWPRLQKISLLLNDIICIKKYPALFHVHKSIPRLACSNEHQPHSLCPLEHAAQMREKMCLSITMVQAQVTLLQQWNVCLDRH